MVAPALAAFGLQAGLAALQGGAGGGQTPPIAGGAGGLPSITGGDAGPSGSDSGPTSISFGSSFAVSGSGGGATASSPEGPTLSELAELGNGGIPWWVWAGAALLVALPFLLWVRR